jgi:hypothetical protein
MTSENISIRTCPKCEAKWINGQHYWTGTNQKGDETQLASLVCDMVKHPDCINPKRNTTKGDGWEKRLENLEARESEY